MTSAIQLAQEILLKPADLDESRIRQLLQALHHRNVDDADLFFQVGRYESWYLEDSEVKSGSYSIDKGVGIRAVSGEKTGFAYCDDIALPSIERAVAAARSIALTSSAAITKTGEELRRSFIHRVGNNGPPSN
jgi:TldD protein